MKGNALLNKLIRPGADKAIAGLLLSIALGGCVEHLPASLPSAELGVTDSVPVGPASGSASSFHFFGWKRFGDDTTEAAMRDAKKGNEDLDLINVLIERRVHCFPACDAALFSWSQTAVTGTLVRYKRMPEWEKPKPPEPKKRILPGHDPEAAELLERLEHLYAEDAKSGADFFNSLDNDTKRAVIERVLADKGRTAAQGWTFVIPRTATPEERKFLAWFVGVYTTYQPLDEQP